MYMNLSIEKINAIKLNFIICMERTGSSMLTAMLNKNEQVLSTSEEPFVLYLHKKYAHKRTFTKSDIDTLVDEFWLTSEKNLSLFFDTKENLKNSLYHYLPNIDFKLLCKIIYLNFIPLKPKDKVEVIVDKQIKYIHYLPLIQEIFPESKFLILVRNHKDVITSWRKRKLGLNQKASYLAKVYHINYSNVTNTLASGNANVRLLKYEDLVTSPKVELNKVCDFFGVGFHENMVEHHTQFNAYIDKMSDKIEDKFLEHIKDFQSNTMKPVSTDLIDEWKKVLTENEVGVAEKINASLDRQFNYTQVSKNYTFTISDRINCLKAIIEKKIYHKLFIESPLWLKMLVKKR
jgi:hypothetical protein